MLAVADLVWQREPERPLAGAVPAGWLDAHIVFAVATYGLLTIGAVAGLAVFLQERALKAKRPTALTRLLPAVAEIAAVEGRLLARAAVAVGPGPVSGAAGGRCHMLS